VLVQIQEQKHTVKLSEVLKNASEEQCFGHFMRIPESSDLDEDHQTKSTVKVCVNGLLMSKAGIGDRMESGYMPDKPIKMKKTK
jgi:hypothetical protein